METIFHEKQEGSLCAQHCLNSLLQGKYFSPVDLADIARQLDDSERCRMAEAGTSSREYQEFLQQPSHNFDDSGFFSVQVLQTALKVWNLILVPFNSSDPIALRARKELKFQSPLICNFKEHWFCIRKLGNQWFNLNSLLVGPELLSETYLSVFLKQLEAEGYSIFIVVGNLPECESDQLLKYVTVDQAIRPQLLSETASSESTSSFTHTDPASSSLTSAINNSLRSVDQDEEEQMKLALAMSLESKALVNTTPHSKVEESSNSLPSSEELRLKRLDFYQKKSNKNVSQNQTDNPSQGSSVMLRDDMNDEEILQAAIQMSLTRDSSAKESISKSP